MTSDVLSKHPRIATFAFPFSIVAFYVACCLTLTSLANYFLLVPVFTAAAYGMALLVDREYRNSTRGKVWHQLSRPPRWVAGLGKGDGPQQKPQSATKEDNSKAGSASAASQDDVGETAPEDRRKEPESTSSKFLGLPTNGESIVSDKKSHAVVASANANALLGMYLPLAFLAFFCGVASVVLGMMSTFSDPEFFFGAVLASLLGFAIARFVLSQLPAERTWQQKLLLYPPVEIFLAIVLAPIVLALPAVVVRLMANQPNLLTLSAGLMSLFVWLSALMFFSRKYCDQVVALMYPFLTSWDGKWAVFGSVACAAGAAVFCAMTFMNFLACWTLQTKRISSDKAAAF